jgi:hypothetical protein
MAYLHDDGRLTPVACGCPNLCRYCSWLAAMENAVVVKTDAAIRLPEIGFTLSTRAAVTPPAKFREDVRLTFRAVRRRWPAAEYLGQIEFTTGHGTRSGGHRRIHQHGLLKCVGRGDVEEVAAVLLKVWRERTGAHRVEAHELHRPAGAIAYLVNHHAKTAQRPPAGWSGKRLRPSKGYYERPITELREEARAHLADKRTRAAVERLLAEEMAWDVADGWRDTDAGDALVDGVLEDARNAGPPLLVRTQRVPTDFGDDGLPCAWTTEIVGTVHDAA